MGFPAFCGDIQSIAAVERTLFVVIESEVCEHWIDFIRGLVLFWDLG